MSNKQDRLYRRWVKRVKHRMKTRLGRKLMPLEILAVERAVQQALQEGQRPPEGMAQ